MTFTEPRFVSVCASAKLTLPETLLPTRNTWRIVSELPPLPAVPPARGKGVEPRDSVNSPVHRAVRHSRKFEKRIGTPSNAKIVLRVHRTQLVYQAASGMSSPRANHFRTSGEKRS